MIPCGKPAKRSTNQKRMKIEIVKIAEQQVLAKVGEDLVCIERSPKIHYEEGMKANFVLEQVGQTKKGRPLYRHVEREDSSTFIKNEAGEMERVDNPPKFSQFSDSELTLGAIQAIGVYLMGTEPENVMNVAAQYAARNRLRKEEER